MSREIVPRGRHHSSRRAVQFVEGVDHLGNYIARHVTPAIERSRRPVELVMNYGRLELDGRVGSHSSRNAVVYNAPGCIMTVADSRRLRHHHHSEPQYYYEQPGADARVFRRNGVCANCYQVDKVDPTGWCPDCDRTQKVRAQFRRIGDVEVRHHAGHCLVCRSPERGEREYVRPDRWRDRLGYRMEHYSETDYDSRG